MSATATAAARHSPRRIHDPGARRILLLIVAAAPRLKRHGRAVEIITDGLRSYGAALKALNATSRQASVRRWKNNRAENSHLPFRRRERAMIRFRRMKTLQKFASVHASVHNHFSQERHLVDRQTYRERRSAALAEWRAVMA